MQQTLSERKPKRHNFFLPLLIAFIFGDIICDNYVLQAFNTQSPIPGFSLFLGLLVVQVFSSPLQAGFSDYYCRKKSLVIALTASMLSLVLILIYDHTMFFSSLVIILLLKGALGNTIPLSWAALADTQERNLRFSLALSTAAYALGYLAISLFKKYFTEDESRAVSIFIYAILVLLCIIIFRDIRDKRNYGPQTPDNDLNFFQLARNEISLLVHLLRVKSLREGLKAFLLWETSLYSILILLVDFESEFPNTAISMMCGYLVGVAILKFCQSVKDETIIRIGYWMSVFFLLLFFILLQFDGSIKFILPFCYFFYTMGNAFLSPTILSLLSKQKKPHQQGKVFGFIESADTIGFLFASIAIIIYKFLQLNLIYILAFSFISFAVSLIPYLRYEKFRASKI